MMKNLKKFNNSKNKSISQSQLWKCIQIEMSRK